MAKMNKTMIAAAETSYFLFYFSVISLLILTVLFIFYICYAVRRKEIERPNTVRQSDPGSYRNLVYRRSDPLNHRNLPTVPTVPLLLRCTFRIRIRRATSRRRSPRCATRTVRARPPAAREAAAQRVPRRARGADRRAIAPSRSRWSSAAPRSMSGLFTSFLTYYPTEQIAREGWKGVK